MIIIRILGILLFLAGAAISADQIMREKDLPAPLTDKGMPELPAVWIAPCAGALGLIITIVSFTAGGKTADPQAGSAPVMTQGVTSWEHIESDTQVIVDDPAPEQPVQEETLSQKPEPVNEAVLNYVWISIPEGFTPDMGDIRGGMDIKFVNLEQDGKAKMSVADGRYKEPFDGNNWKDMVNAVYQAVHMTDTLPDTGNMVPEEREDKITACRITLADGEGMFMFREGSSAFIYVTADSAMDPDVAKAVMRNITDQFGEKPKDLDANMGIDASQVTGSAISFSTGSYSPKDKNGKGLKKGKYSVRVVGDDIAVVTVYPDNTHTDAFRVAASYPDGHSDQYTKYSPQGSTVIIGDDSEIYIMDGTATFTPVR